MTEPLIDDIIYRKLCEIKHNNVNNFTLNNFILANGSYCKSECRRLLLTRTINKFLIDNDFSSNDANECINSLQYGFVLIQ